MKARLKVHPVLSTIREKRPLVHVGWLVASDVRGDREQDDYRTAASRLREVLDQQFPQFEWRVSYLQRHRYAPQGVVDPLQLLEFGVQEKTAQHWDYALVVVSNGLLARERVHTIGVPSSALETAVFSTADLRGNSDSGEFVDGMVALALHLLGHLWGLEHEEEGVMAPPESPAFLRSGQYSPEHQAIVADRLDEVADKRLEEQSRQWNRLTFYWRAFWADPKSILIDIIGYKPWRLPLRMGRLTAAAAISLVILLLAAEAWEIGVNMTSAKLLIGNIAAILIATAFIFAGQNLGQVSREVGWREQLARTRIVILGTVLLGIFSLWVVLFCLTLLIGFLLPESTIENWIQVEDLGRSRLVHQAAFMAMLGVLAGALGGNLENEEAIKAGLFFDEET